MINFLKYIKKTKEDIISLDDVSKSNYAFQSKKYSDIKVSLLKKEANLKYGKGDYLGTIEALNLACKIEPLGQHSADLYVKAEKNLARQEIKELRKNKKDADAILRIEEFLKKWPNDIEILKSMALSKAAVQDYYSVLDILDYIRTMESLGKHTSSLYEEVKNKLLPKKMADLERNKDYSGVLSLLEKELDREPSNCNTLRKIASTKSKLKDYKGAFNAIEKVRELGDFGPGAKAFQEKIAIWQKRSEQNAVHYYVDVEGPIRLEFNQIFATLSKYDVVSFDIFDTAIVRAVSQPDDVFRLMGCHLGVTDFVKKRKRAESIARSQNDRDNGTREVTLDIIYDVFAQQAGATDAWKSLEQSFEIQLTRQNPYIFNLYEKLRALGKKIVFTSDMYLPKVTLEKMLAKAGYEGYAHIYLSNEHKARKGDGTLQKILMADHSDDQSIVHVGDVLLADVTKSLEVGIHAVFNPNQHGFIREKDMGSLAGSFYEAVIDNKLGTGMWSENLHYTHGFRIGGILALGYIEFIDQLVKNTGSEKILFLGRDCDILSKIYRKHFNTVSSSYVETSRAAALMLTIDSNFDDYLGRTFFRWYKESNNSRPLQQLLIETGFAYLVNYLEDADIEPLQFPASADEQRIREFLWSHKSVIEAHLAPVHAAARDYFKDAIGDAKKIVVADIGWTGTCITTLRDYLRSTFGDAAPQVYGALLGTSRNQQVMDSVSDGSISSYVYSPVMNQDITRLMMPGGKMDQRQRDLLTLPVEYLFTETKASTVSYGRDADGRALAIRGENRPANIEQIDEMQRGMLDFAEIYLNYSKGFENLRQINAYSAFQPLRNALGHKAYLYAIYKDFMYDAVTVINASSAHESFGALFNQNDIRAYQSYLGTESVVVQTQSNLPKILFVSPEMPFTGAVHSLLRICKVAASVGYAVQVWTEKAGPFMQQFEKNNIPVSVVASSSITANLIGDLKRDGVKLVVCNTVVTDRYVEAFEGKLPVVWYVREATNIPQFLRGNIARTQTLKNSSSVTVVSDYAAAAVSKFSNGPIEVVKNAVEDVTALALPYIAKKDDKVRFVQLGTIEHRKGYDVFVTAFKAMPDAYKARAELHFAGGFINSGTSFSSYLFGQIKDEPAIHYHGLIADTKLKIELLSQMDAVVVASRDESCSLVALEGCMLSKPLIVTDNVGANYMVGQHNGCIIATADVLALRDAYMQMIDKSADELIAMGTDSRARYEQFASMQAHSRDLKALFEKRIANGPIAPCEDVSVPMATPETYQPELVVSLTSYPPRMPTIGVCIQSLKRQSKRPNRIILWLSEDQYPNKEQDLPETLLTLQDDLFSIEWVSGDLGPHKKYFYAMQKYPDAAIVTVDDDVQYDSNLIETLYQEHLAHPKAVIPGRSNLIRFRPDGTLRIYDQWAYDYQHLREIETYALLPTGIGGVLYPPHALPQCAFDADLIQATCKGADDLWLKVMTAANGYPVWMPKKKFGYMNIDGSQVAALWRTNAFHGGNDVALENILAGIEQRYGVSDAIMKRIWGVDDATNTFVGPGDQTNYSPII